jgi:hypothetical protein
MPIQQPENLGSASQSSASAGREDDWQNHEHKADLTHGQAKQLIESAGSADLAKHAIDVANQQSDPLDAVGPKSSEVESPPEAQTELARSLGYASYLDLFESSKPAGEVGQKHWLVTADEGGHWVMWNDVEFKVEGQFDSQQAALSAAGTALRKPK